MANSQHIKRSKRIRKKLKKINTERFRLSIFRSSKNISAQIIDSKSNKTLISATSNDKVNKGKALQIFVRFFKKNNNRVKSIAVGDNYNDLDMLKNSDFPCLVFNDKFTLDKIPINNLITTNKPSPEGWADVIKMALAKVDLNY